MVYSRPDNTITATWLPDGSAELILTLRGRDWTRLVAREDVVTLLEAAALLGVSRSAPYQWIKQNRLLAFPGVLEDGNETTVVRLSDLWAFGKQNGFI